MQDQKTTQISVRGGFASLRAFSPPVLLRKIFCVGLKGNNPVTSAGKKRKLINTFLISTHSTLKKLL